MHHRTKILILLLIASATFCSSSTGNDQAPRHSTAANSTCLLHERDALLAFKQGITSDPAGRLASWDEGDDDCCRWRGVRCSNQTETGHVVVVGLHLRNMQQQDDPKLSLDETALSGQISPSLLSLHHLEHLDLSVNNLSGTTGRVPEFLGLLQNLRYLNLSGMPFSGRVPPQLGNLSKLHYLDLSCKRVPFVDWSRPKLYSTDISWVSNLPLRYLNMDSDLTGVLDWAHVVNMVPSLKVLRLPSCSLEVANQSLPHLNLTDLEKLSLSGNYFNNSVESCWFGSLPSLQHLELASTYLYGEIPGLLGGMMSLQLLDFSYSRRNIDIMTANIKNLCNLESLDLTGSNLNGDIFELLPKCFPHKLKRLELAGNNFTGVLTNWIGNLSNVHTLDLSGNQLTGALPSEISMLTNLLTLDLSYNLFTGHVPFEIALLNNLTTLDLSGNNFSGVITHEHLVGLTNLKSLDLSTNSLKIVVDPEWFPAFRLEFAYFASCKLGPPFPTWLQSQVYIRQLDISRASISDMLPSWFSSTFSNVSFLNISNNAISGTLPTNLENMTSLRTLYLNSNQLTGPIPRFPILLFNFDISDNNLSGSLPSDFGTPYSQYLNLANNHITGPIPQSICHFENLIALNLANNLLNGEFPLCHEPMRVNILILRNNRLFGEFPESLKTWPDLYILDLAWNIFSGRLPMWIGDFSSLQILQLSHNTFTGSIPATITRLNGISQLNLAGNRLSGPLPRSMSNLTGMTRAHTPTFSAFKYLPQHRFGNIIISTNIYEMVHVNLSVIMKGQERYYKDGAFYTVVSIDLSLNQLTGGIPDEITSLDGIVNLNLSWNQLSGNIPRKIGAMQSLQSLDLKENMLYGEIPQGMANLSFLSILDLSYNNLSGRIPSSSQLDTLYQQNNFMYDGNIGLCGHPLPKNCSNDSEPKHDHERDERDHKVLSFSFGLGVGYVVGLWVVFCVILFKKSWRIAYFQLIDKAFNRGYVLTVVTWRGMCQRDN